MNIPTDLIQDANAYARKNDGLEIISILDDDNTVQRKFASIVEHAIWSYPDRAQIIEVPSDILDGIDRYDPVP